MPWKDGLLQIFFFFFLAVYIGCFILHRWYMLRWVGLGPMSPYVQNWIKWVSEKKSGLPWCGGEQGRTEMGVTTRICSVLCWFWPGMQGVTAALRVVTSRQGQPAGLGGPFVPHLPTGHLISHEPKQEPLVQAGLCQPSSWVHGNRAVAVQCCSSLLTFVLTF